MVEYKPALRIPKIPGFSPKNKRRIIKLITTRKIRKMITNKKEDKLSYDKESEVYTFKTKTHSSASYVVGLLRFILRKFEPKFLELYRSTKSWKSKNITIRFYLKNKEEV